MKIASTTLRYLLALGGGSIAVYAFNPYNQWAILYLSVGILYLLLQSTSVRTALRCSFVFGIGFFGTGVSWIYVSIHDFGNTSSALAYGLTALFILGLAWLFFVPWCAFYKWVTSKHQTAGSDIFVFSSCWTLGEGFRSGFATGFPWLLNGYSFIDTPVASWAPVIGVYGLSFLQVMLSTSMVSVLLYPRQLYASFAFAMCLIIILLSWPLKHVHWTEPFGTPLTFGAVQGDIPQKLHWDPEYVDYILQTYQHLSTQVIDKKIVIWPENAIPVVYQNTPELIKTLKQRYSNLHSALVLGIPWKIRQHYYNAATVLGDGQGHYLKQKLVPFGEYVPFQKQLSGIIQFFDLPMPDFSTGPSHQRHVKVHGHPVAIYICYESVYPDFATRLARKSDFIINISNNAWFGHSIGPYQYFQMVRMRALETGRYIINVSSQSLTALIAPSGKVIDQTPDFEPSVLKGQVPSMRGKTPFMQMTSLPIFILCILCIILRITRAKRNKPYNVDKHIRY